MKAAAPSPILISAAFSRLFLRGQSRLRCRVVTSSPRFVEAFLTPVSEVFSEADRDAASSKTLGRGEEEEGWEEEGWQEEEEKEEEEEEEGRRAR